MFPSVKNKNFIYLKIKIIFLFIISHPNANFPLSNNCYTYMSQRNNSTKLKTFYSDYSY